MSTNKPSRTQQQAADQSLIDGLTKHAADLPSLLIGQATLKTADLTGILQARIDARDASVSTRATWQAAVQAERDGRAKTRDVVNGLRQALLVAFGGSADSLADFGLKPRKVAVVAPEVKAAAAAKARATRAARHTMGPKQKAKIKGTVPAPAPAPSPSPTEPPSPAPPAPGPAASTARAP